MAHEELPPIPGTEGLATEVREALIAVGTNHKINNGHLRFVAMTAADVRQGDILEIPTRSHMKWYVRHAPDPVDSLGKIHARGCDKLRRGEPSGYIRTMTMKPSDPVMIDRTTGVESE
jgi:hypothetical protein